MAWEQTTGGQGGVIATSGARSLPSQPQNIIGPVPGSFLAQLEKMLAEHPHTNFQALTLQTQIASQSKVPVNQSGTNLRFAYSTVVPLWLTFYLDNPTNGGIPMQAGNVILGTSFERFYVDIPASNTTQSIILITWTDTPVNPVQVR